MTFTIAERIDSGGSVRPGHFTVTVDDGTGSPSADLIAQVAAAVDAVRPIGGTYSVRPPVLVPVNVRATVIGTTQGIAAAQAAMSAFISALPIGASLMISRLYQVVHDADPGITSVVSLTVNAASTDVAPGVFGLIRPNQVSVTA